MPSKSVMVLLEKSKNLKNVFDKRNSPSGKKVKKLKYPKKRYGCSGKKVKSWKMFFKNFTGELGIIETRWE